MPERRPLDALQHAPICVRCRWDENEIHVKIFNARTVQWWRVWRESLIKEGTRTAQRDLYVVPLAWDYLPLTLIIICIASHDLGLCAIEMWSLQLLSSYISAPGLSRHAWKYNYITIHNPECMVTSYIRSCVPVSRGCICSGQKEEKQSKSAARPRTGIDITILYGVLGCIATASDCPAFKGAYQS